MFVMRDNATFHLVIGGAVGAMLAVSAMEILRRRKWNSLSRQYDQSSLTTSPANDGLSDFLNDEILREQFTRNIQFFGQKGQQKIANAFVVVIGLGVSAGCLQSSNKLQGSPLAKLTQMLRAGCWEPCCPHAAQIRGWQAQTDRL